MAIMIRLGYYSSFYCFANGSHDVTITIFSSALPSSSSEPAFLFPTLLSSFFSFFLFFFVGEELPLLSLGGL